MTVTFTKNREYHPIEETRIETADGAFYQALDPELGREVGLKLVRIQGDTPHQREENYKNAMREVKAMVRIGEKTRRIPRIYETHFDPEAGEMYIVMEWIPGDTLDVAAPAASKKQFLRWMADLCAILWEMEQLDIYHKDIKPKNIMITKDNTLYLIDFNISLSLPNPVEGSKGYKAPEMDPGSKFSGRSKVDMFSIGVLLYERLTGKIPERGTDYGTNFLSPNKWTRFTRAADMDATIPADVDEIIFNCMQLAPKKRYSSMSQLHNAIREALKAYGK